MYGLPLALTGPSFIILFLVLEERAVYYRETKNGLYTTLPFILSNTLVNMPFLFVCTVIFTVICYWAIVSNFTLIWGCY